MLALSKLAYLLVSRQLWGKSTIRILLLNLQTFAIRLRRNELINTSIFTGIASVINIASVFIVQKVIAVLLGPSGVALVGQYQNFLGIVTSLSTGGVNTGVVKYIAEYKKDYAQSARSISNATRITLCCSGILSIILLIFAEPLSQYLFDGVNYTLIIRLLGLTIPLYALNSLLVAILNGFGETKKFAGSAIARSLVILTFTSLLAYLGGVQGALVALSISQSIVFFITLFFVVKSPWFLPNFFSKTLDWKLIKSYFGFSLIALVTFVVDPTVLIQIRKLIISNLSAVDAGYWDAMRKISQGYLSIATGTLGVYYLPKLSSLHSRTDLQREIKNGYRLIFPITLVIFLLIYLLREPIVLLLYTREFLRINDFFLLTLSSDLISLMAWLLSYLLLAKAMIKLYIKVSLTFSMIKYIFSIVFLHFMGLEGIFYAQLAKSTLYFLVIILIFRHVMWSTTISQDVSNEIK